MKATGIIRNIDELGRIVIPKELRTKLEIRESDPIEIYTEDDRIILAKYYPSCIFCGEGKDVTFFKGKKICAKCLSELENKAD